MAFLYNKDENMRSILEQVYFDNTIKSYLIEIGIILLAILFKRYLSKYIAGLLYKLIAKAGGTFQKKSFCDLVVEPLDSFLVLFISFIALEKLNFPKVLDFKVFKVTSKTIVDSFANALLIIVFIWLCLRVIDFIAMILEDKANATKDQTDNQLVLFFKDFFKVILIIVGVLLILRFSFNKNIGNLLTGLSLVGAALALATRESLENLIASFIIFFDKPFVTGDIVKVLNFSGTVEKIGLRSTRIRTESKTYITVPNKQMVDSILDNISLRTQRKVDIRLEIGLQANIEELKQLPAAIDKILNGFSAIENSAVNFTETGKNAHIFMVEYFTTVEQEIADFNNDKEQINFAILEVLQSKHLQLAATATNINLHTVGNV